MNSLSLFSLVALATVATPGPTTLLALNNGARRGLGFALPGIAGAICSDIVLIAAVAGGLGAVLAASVWLFELLRWIGVAYLAWLGWQALRNAIQPGSAMATSPAPSDPSRAVMRRSFVVAVTNPKGYLFFSALLPSIIDGQTAVLPQYLMLTVIFVVIDATVMLAYAAIGAVGVRRVNGRSWGRRVDQASGFALLAMAAGLGLWEKDA
ncbi:MAG: LysE family translocator [Burkholderiaceae bacterium]